MSELWGLSEFVIVRLAKTRKTTQRIESALHCAFPISAISWQKITLDKIEKPMYAFTPVQCDSQPECYVELSRSPHGPPFGLQAAFLGNKHLRQYQAREVFHIACETLGVETPYAIEKLLSGESFESADPPRWWEKLRDGRFDLVRALARNDPKSREWMGRLSKYTDKANRMLAMPLWKLSQPSRVSVNAVVTWRPAVEAMGVQIPQFPDRSKNCGLRYAEQLFKLLKNPQTRCAGINVAVFCLRLAQARGDLAHYVLTYETLVDDKWFWYARSQSQLGDLLLFYGEWFSTLQLDVRTESDLIEIEEELTAYGLSVDFVRYSQRDDPRYALVNSLFESSADNEKKSLVLKVSIPKLGANNTRNSSHCGPVY